MTASDHLKPLSEGMRNQLIGLITWMHQVVHCSHDGGKDNCTYEICKCATLMRKELEKM